MKPTAGAWSVTHFTSATHSVPVVFELLGASSEARLKQLRLRTTLFTIFVVTFGSLIMVLGRLSIWGSPSAGQPPIHPRPRQRAILVAILIAAAGLRFYALDFGLWHDEVLTYVRYARMSFGEIVSTYWDQNQHFLYSLLAHASFSAFGESAWSLRLPAVFFGIASIWALYLLGRQVSTEREALLATALLAFSYHHIWFSQNARGYIGLLFWTILASWLFLRGLDETQPRHWICYAASAALGVYTNTAMVFVIASHFIIYLFRLWAYRKGVWPQRWAGLFLGFFLAGFLTVALHALVLPQMLSGVVGEESTVELWKHPLWTFLEFVKAIELGFGGSLVALAVFSLFGMGLWSFARTRPVVIGLLTVPILICAATVVGMGHHVWPRLFFFSFGFAALVIIRGTTLAGRIATRLFRIASASRLSIGTAFSLGLIFVSALAVPRAYAPKQDFLGALNFIEAAKQPGDAIATVGLASFTYQNLYKQDWKELKTLEDLNSLRAQVKRTWVVYTFPTQVGAVYPEIMATIEKDFQIVKQFPGTVGEGTIFVSRFEGVHSW